MSHSEKLENLAIVFDKMRPSGVKSFYQFMLDYPSLRRDLLIQLIELIDSISPEEEISSHLRLIKSLMRGEDGKLKYDKTLDIFHEEETIIGHALDDVEMDEYGKGCIKYIDAEVREKKMEVRKCKEEENAFFVEGSGEKILIDKELYIKQKSTNEQSIYNALQELIPSKKIPIPSKVHFIWLGSIIPTKYEDTLIKIASAIKSGDVYEMFIYVDKISNIKPFLRLELQDLGVKFKLVSEVLGDAAYYPKEGMKKWLSICFLRECVGLCNFGAASDILRYMILWQGGFYLDMDIKFYDTPMDSLIMKGQRLFSRIYESEHGFLCNVEKESGLYYEPEGCITKDNITAFYEFCNDAIAAIPKHPIILDMLNNVIKNYKIANITYSLLEFCRYGKTDELKYFSTFSETTSSLMDRKRLPTPFSFSLISEVYFLSKLTSKCYLTKHLSGVHVVAGSVFDHCSREKLEIAEFISGITLYTEGGSEMLTADGCPFCFSYDGAWFHDPRIKVDIKRSSDEYYWRETVLYKGYKVVSFDAEGASRG